MVGQKCTCDTPHLGRGTHMHVHSTRYPRTEQAAAHCVARKAAGGRSGTARDKNGRTAEAARCHARPRLVSSAHLDERVCVGNERQRRCRRRADSSVSQRARRPPNLPRSARRHQHTTVGRCSGKGVKARLCRAPRRALRRIKRYSPDVDARGASDGAGAAHWRRRARPIN